MPLLLDLPNEILDELMECILAISPPSQLQAFLFSRQFNPSAVRAIYLNLQFTVNSDLQMKSFWGLRDRTMTIKTENNLMFFDLLADTALQSPHLFAHTHTVQLKIFETYSTTLSNSTWTRGLNFSGLHESDPTCAAIWAKSVCLILTAVSAVEHLVCDWFMDMEGVPPKIRQLSRLRILEIRGIKYLGEDPKIATLPEDFILPAGLEKFRISLLGFDPQLIFKMASTPNTTTAPLKLEAVDCCCCRLPYESESEFDDDSAIPTQPEPESEFDDDSAIPTQYEPESEFDDDSAVPTVTTSRARFTEARFIYNEFALDEYMDAWLEESYDALETLEILDGCHYDTELAAEFYSRWSHLTELRRLSLSYWNVPEPSMASECRLEKLTHLQINVPQEVLDVFSPLFEEVLWRIKEGGLFPKLASIKLSTLRTDFSPKDDGTKWSSLRLYIQHEWSDKGPSEFCGWKKGPYLLEEAPHNASGIYKFASGIEFDITDILAMAKKLEPKTKRTPLCRRLTEEESLKMAMTLK
ncbi:hypothetical protein E2P81_ATG08736 [Venturia nashicola]|nr:hypothetical protein E2P81_ATG08736 [Venturia nashicola]